MTNEPEQLASLALARDFARPLATSSPIAG